MNKARFSGRIAVTGHLLLLTLIFAWIAVIDPPQYWPRSLLLLIAVLPLALPVRGLLYGRPRSFLYSALISLPYALHGASELYVGSERFDLPLAELMLSLLLLFSSVLHIRWSTPSGETAR